MEQDPVSKVGAQLEETFDSFIALARESGTVPVGDIPLLWRLYDRLTGERDSIAGAISGLAHRSMANVGPEHLDQLPAVWDSILGKGRMVFVTELQNWAAGCRLAAVPFLLERICSGDEWSSTAAATTLVEIFQLARATEDTEYEAGIEGWTERLAAEIEKHNLSAVRALIVLPDGPKIVAKACTSLDCPVGFVKRAVEYLEESGHQKEVARAFRAAAEDKVWLGKVVHEALFGAHPKNTNALVMTALSVLLGPKLKK